MTESAMRKVLLVKTSSLGDVIHAMPAITEAAAHSVTFTWVVEEAFAEVAALHPDVDTVIPVALRRWRKGEGDGVASQIQGFVHQLRRQRFDLILDSQGLIKSALLASLARGPRAGFSHTSAREPWASFFYGQRKIVATGQHAIQRQRQLFAQALGYELQPGLPVGLQLDVPVTRQVVLLHGTTWQTKHWPELMWRDLADHICAAGYEPVVTWGNAGEQERAQRLAQHPGVNMVEKKPLSELANLLAGAAGVIGVDTGLSHLSATMGTPTVGLYGPTSPSLTGCMGAHSTSLNSTLACAPCLSSSCRRYNGEPLRFKDQVVEPPCFAQLTPDQVWHEASRLIEAAGRAVR